MASRRPRWTIDINGATAEALNAIPGLRGHGHDIVQYRLDRGGFDALAQLTDVPGLTIDETTLAYLRV